jgi:hypothetical protein
MRAPGSMFLALALALTGCAEDDISVSSAGQADYGRGEVMAAVEALSTSDRSPAAYRRMAEAVRAARPHFDEVTAELAERNLVFLAVPPLVAWHGRPLDQQLEALALTVWPTALGVEPKPDEQPREYLERVCRGELALECKNIVPEAYSLALSALVWRRFKERARDIMSDCRPCRQDQAYREALDKLERSATEIEVRAQREADDADPGHWPVGEVHAQPWSDAPLFHVDDDGDATFRGIGVAPGTWRQVLEQDRQGSQVLGVLLEPDDRVSVLRQIVKDARAAGYRELALQVRGPEHPYPLREYRISIDRKRGRRDPAVNTRDVDTIQILVQMLDAALENGTGPLKLR